MIMTTRTQEILFLVADEMGLELTDLFGCEKEQCEEKCRAQYYFFKCVRVLMYRCQLLESS